MIVMIVAIVVNSDISVGATDCTPETDTSEVIVDFFFFRGNANRRHERFQSTTGKFRIRVLLRLTEGNEPTPAHRQEAPSTSTTGFSVAFYHGFPEALSNEISLSSGMF